MEPPILANFSDKPMYEVNTMVQLLRVRPLALWSWEQHLGMASGDASADPNRHKRRYSERDLAALLWLRDRVIAGDTPQDASARLLGAQRGMRGLGYGVSGALSTGPMTLEPSTFTQPPSMQSGALSTGALHDFSDQIGLEEPFTLPPTGALYQYTSPPTGTLGGASFQGPNTSGARYPTMGRTGQQEPWAADPWEGASRSGAPQIGGPSGRLGSVYASPAEAPAFPARGYTMSQSLSSLRELRPAVPQLLQAFARFDTARANAVVNEALHNHGVDNVCVGLAQPAVLRISELWSKSELSNPEERFGLNYLRGFMLNIFHNTLEPIGAPFAVVGCAPNESSDFGALLLAVLWRRAGLRVAYLGRGVDGDQLVSEQWPITPAIIALTATNSQRVRTMARIAKKLSEMPAPQPLFAYWGPIFVRNPDLRRKLSGVYLGDDAPTATHHARQLVNLDFSE